MNIKSFCGGFDSNFTYLIWDDTNEAAIIDASNGVHPILDFAEENGLKIKYVFLMHSHFDHLEGIGEYRKKGIEILGHESMSFKLDKKLKDLVIIHKFDFDKITKSMNDVASSKNYSCFFATSSC